MANANRKSRRQGASESAPAGGWQIVFSGFVLILLCFFIMLSSFATMEKTKVLQFVEAFSSSLSILPGGVKLSKGARILPHSEDIIPNNSEMAKLFQELQEWVDEDGLHEKVALITTPEGLMLRFSDALVFDSGSADLTDAARRILDHVSRTIKRSPFEIRIEGHTDDLPISSRKYPSNWELSTARAVNVLRFFAEEKQVRADRMTAVGFGEFRPIAANDTEAHRGFNRRVEIIFLNLSTSDAPERTENGGSHEKASAA